MLIKHEERYRNEALPQGLMDAMGKFVEESFKNGSLVDTAGLQPSSAGARIRVSRGKAKVIDGPFTESKEIIGGYAIVEAPSRAEALRLARRFLDAHVRAGMLDLDMEIRPMFDEAGCGNGKPG